MDKIIYSAVSNIGYTRCHGRLSSYPIIRTFSAKVYRRCSLTYRLLSKPFIEQIDPDGEIDTWSGNHSESLVKNWHNAQYGGNYSISEKECLSNKYVDAQIFSAYLAVLLALQNGKARIVKTKKILPKTGQENDDEYLLDEEMPSTVAASSGAKSKVFIVHGHDELAQIKVAQFIEKLGMKAIILHEQATAGRTIIESIEAFTDVGFAVVIYTPCDIGAVNKESPNLRGRARQNVVFEHGYLIAKLGRGNVCQDLPRKISAESERELGEVVERC